MHMLFENMRVREELNKLKFYVLCSLADRFGEHLRSVEGYNHNPRYHGGGFPVAEHFNLADHNNIQDMKVSVVKQVNGGTAPRQREERRLIFKLKTLAPNGMNIEFKFI